MKKYIAKDSRGEEHSYGFIGAHHFAPNCFAGGMISAYSERFENDDWVSI